MYNKNFLWPLSHLFRAIGKNSKPPMSANKITKIVTKFLGVKFHLFFIVNSITHKVFLPFSDGTLNLKKMSSLTLFVHSELRLKCRCVVLLIPLKYYYRFINGTHIAYPIPKPLPLLLNEFYTVKSSLCYCHNALLFLNRMVVNARGYDDLMTF